MAGKDLISRSYDDEKPIVDWHTDSYPFVCVTMLSDCTGMIGGETALKTGTGDVMKVRGPEMVRVEFPAPGVKLNWTRAAL